MSPHNYYTCITHFPSGIRLNSHQYSQLTDKLQAPIRTARTVVIQQSLSDRFISAFREQVQRNGMYQIPQGSPVSAWLLKFNASTSIIIIGFGAMCWLSSSSPTSQNTENVCTS